MGPHRGRVIGTRRSATCLSALVGALKLTYIDGGVDARCRRRWGVVLPRYELILILEGTGSGGERAVIVCVVVAGAGDVGIAISHRHVIAPILYSIGPLPYASTTAGSR